MAADDVQDGQLPFHYTAEFGHEYHTPEELFSCFLAAEDCCDIVLVFRQLIKTLNIDPTLHGHEFYEVLTSKLTSWKCQSLWDLLNARLKHNEYKQGTIGKDLNVLIIGAGPVGLRTAIETLLLGCRTVVVEKRESFTRNNVLHLWSFLLTDFRSLGAKKFYGKFGSGSIDHINIKTLQCILLKVALVLGLEIYSGVGFKHLVEPTENSQGWRAVFEPENHELSQYYFKVVIGADGKKNVLPGFPQIELRGALAIGITCNFVNNNTIEENRVPEISGISYQFNPQFFDEMHKQHGVKLENIVYYKNETHYFVMTALKSSLLGRGVIKKDESDPAKLLHRDNIDFGALVEFTRTAVGFATNYQLPPLQFKIVANGQPDIALFDFTSIKKAANASRIVERKKHLLLMALVGDSLIEPFWPTGSGCGRGVLSALDTAWMVRQYALKEPALAVLRERENIFKLLSGTSNDNLIKNYKAYTIDPSTRYPAIETKKVININSLKALYDTDDKESAEYNMGVSEEPKGLNQVSKRPARRRTSSSGSSGGRKKSLSYSHVHPHGQHAPLQPTKSKRRADRAVVEEKHDVGKAKEFWEEHNKKRGDSVLSEGASQPLTATTEASKPQYSRQQSAGKRKSPAEHAGIAKPAVVAEAKEPDSTTAAKDNRKTLSARKSVGRARRTLIEKDVQEKGSGKTSRYVRSYLLQKNARRKSSKSLHLVKGSCLEGSPGDRVILEAKSAAVRLRATCSSLKICEGSHHPLDSLSLNSALEDVHKEGKFADNAGLGRAPVLQGRTSAAHERLKQILSKASSSANVNTVTKSVGPLDSSAAGSKKRDNCSLSPEQSSLVYSKSRKLQANQCPGAGLQGPRSLSPVYECNRSSPRSILRRRGQGTRLVQLKSLKNKRPSMMPVRSLKK